MESKLEDRYLGEFEEIILLAVLRLGKNAYGMRIRREVEDGVGRATSIGAIYTTLERLQQKGIVSSWQGEATPERGGRAKRYYKVERVGMAAIRDNQLVRQRMLQGADLAWESIGM